MKALFATTLSLTLTLTAGTAMAQTDIPAMIAADGLRATEAELAALGDPSADERFALGGVRFLAALESALQLRWRVGMTDGLDMLFAVPILRLPLAENPSPEPFDPDMIEAMFAGIVTDMEGAIAVLDSIGDSDDVGLTLDFGDLWLDVNDNGARDEGEDLGDVAGFVLSGGFGGPMPTATVRFDTADAAWLAAYAHLLAGIGEAVLAVGPSEPIARVIAAAEGLEAIAGPPVDPYGMSSFAGYVDFVAMLVLTLEQQPDAERSRAAHAHFLSMIADNRMFWTRVARETDNDAEWIPNKSQISALGLPFPPDTGTQWLAVLADMEKVLQGDLLIPYWRLGPGAGLNLERMFRDPPPLDPVGLIQGETVLPYAEVGPLANMQSLRQFEALIGGNAGLYIVMLN